jgi:hypothetical protein
MNNLTLLDFVVIVKNHFVHLLKLNATGHAGSSSNASDLFLLEGIYSKSWPRHSGRFN